MTFILALATSNYAVLLADHNSTVPEDGKWRLVDEIVKTWIFDRHYAVGFAGLSRFKSSFALKAETLDQQPGTRMSDWIFNELAGVTREERFQTLANKFGPACERDNYWGYHWFFGVGFEPQTLRPETIEVNNETFKHSFDVSYHHISADEKYVLRTAGGNFTDEESADLAEYLQRSLSASAEIDAYTLIPLLVKLMRGVAARSKGRIGTSCTVTTFPVSAVPLPEYFTMWTGVPERWVFQQSEVTISIGSRKDPFDNRVFSPSRLDNEFGNIHTEQMLVTTNTDVLQHMRRVKELPFRRS